MASGSRDDKSQFIKEEIHPVMKDLQERAALFENISTKNSTCLSNNQTSDIIESSNSNNNVQTTQINNSNIHELHNQDLFNNVDRNLTVTYDEIINYNFPPSEELTCEDASDIYECESFDYETSMECLTDIAAEYCYVGDLDNPEIYDYYEPEENYFYND